MLTPLQSPSLLWFYGWTSRKLPHILIQKPKVIPTDVVAQPSAIDQMKFSLIVR